MVRKEEFLRENGFEKEGQEEVSRSDFPSDFVFGVATSAYQVCHSSMQIHWLDLLVFLLSLLQRTFLHSLIAKL